MTLRESKIAMDNSPFTDEFPFRNDLTISNMSIHGGYSWIVPLFMGDFHGFSHVPRLDDLGVSSMFFDLCGTPKRRDEAISQLGKSQQWQQALELLQAIQCAFHKKWKGQIHHFITHRIHVWYICQHLPSISPNVSIYTSTMDPMGNMSIYVISFPSPVFFGFFYAIPCLIFSSSQAQNVARATSTATWSPSMQPSAPVPRWRWCLKGLRSSF